MNKIKILELFGGIGACSKALERLGIDYEIVDYVEIDKYAVKSFNAIHNTNFESQDITTWDKNIEVDLIMHGSPCQDFSLSGKQAGGDEGSGTRSSLMYETIRIVEKLKPKYVIWENVKNIISKNHVHNFNNYINRMSKLGYNSFYKVLNAKDYGIPQNRERVFTVSILDGSNYEFPKSIPLKLKLKDMLEDEVDEKYFLSDKMIKYISADNEKWSGNNDKALINKTCASTINTNEGSRRCDASNYVSSDFDENYNLKNKLCDCLGIAIKNNTKKGYLVAHEGDSINLTYPNSNTRRGRVGEQVSQTLQCNENMGVVTKYKEYSNFYIIPRGSDGKLINGSYNRVWKEENQVGTINLTKIQEIGKKDEYKNLRIRKLTPKECWRLMGFDDEDFEKASKVCSNAQLYKQAGNSIVVNVLEGILKNLIDLESEVN